MEQNVKYTITTPYGVYLTLEKVNSQTLAVMIEDGAQDGAYLRAYLNAEHFDQVEAALQALGRPVEVYADGSEETESEQPTVH